jgi:hypothetical protein
MKNLGERLDPLNSVPHAVSQLIVGKFGTMIAVRYLRNRLLDVLLIDISNVYLDQTINKEKLPIVSNGWYSRGALCFGESEAVLSSRHPWKVFSFPQVLRSSDGTHLPDADLCPS